MKSDSFIARSSLSACPAFFASRLTPAASASHRSGTANTCVTPCSRHVFKIVSGP